MTSIAVTASICATASEAALLVASFMPFSLALGVSHRCPGRPDDSDNFLYSEHPTTSIRLDKSPLSEYRRHQDRGVMRRLFDSDVTRLARPRTMEIVDQKSENFNRRKFARPLKLLLAPRPPDTVGIEPAFDTSSMNKSENPRWTMARIDYCDTTKSNERT